MNAEENIARQTLKMLGAVNRLLRNHAVALERKPRVTSTATRLEVVDYQSGSMIEGYVDAQMDDGTGLSWNVDVRWDDNSFQIDATLDRNSKAGTETLKQFPVEEARGIENLSQSFIRVTQALLAVEPGGL